MQVLCFATWVKVPNRNRFWNKKLGIFIKTAPCNQKTDTFTLKCAFQNK